MSHSTILIVDDEVNQRLLLAQVLASLEPTYTIRLAASAAEALAVLDGGPVRLIITDYAMPAMTGLDLVAALRSANIATPVILMSAYTFDEIVAAALRLQVDYFLVKPFPIERLRRLTDALLDPPA